MDSVTTHEQRTVGNNARNLVVCDVDLSDIIPEYLEGKRAECLQIRELANGAACGEIRSIAHGMKGSGGCYGFPEITGIGASMESAAIAADLQGVRAQVALLEAYLDCIEVCYE